MNVITFLFRVSAQSSLSLYFGFHTGNIEQGSRCGITNFHPENAERNFWRKLNNFLGYDASNHKVKTSLKKRSWGGRERLLNACFLKKSKLLNGIQMDSKISTSPYIQQLVSVFKLPSFDKVINIVLINSSNLGRCIFLSLFHITFLLLLLHSLSTAGGWN